MWWRGDLAGCTRFSLEPTSLRALSPLHQLRWSPSPSHDGEAELRLLLLPLPRFHRVVEAGGVVDREVSQVGAVGDAHRKAGGAVAFAAVGQAVMGVGDDHGEDRVALDVGGREGDLGLDALTVAGTDRHFGEAGAVALDQLALHLALAGREHPGGNADVAGRARALIVDDQLELDDRLVAGDSGANRVHLEG